MLFTNKPVSRQSRSFKTITVGLLSPEEMLDRSFGEVLKPETINYRSYKPEKMAYSVKRFSVLPKTGNVTVVNINEFVTGGSYVIAVALK